MFSLTIPIFFVFSYLLRQSLFRIFEVIAWYNKFNGVNVARYCKNPKQWIGNMRLWCSGFKDLWKFRKPDSVSAPKFLFLDHLFLNIFIFEFCTLPLPLHLESSVGQLNPIFICMFSLTIIDNFYFWFLIYCDSLSLGLQQIGFVNGKVALCHYIMGRVALLQSCCGASLCLQCDKRVCVNSVGC